MSSTILCKNKFCPCACMCTGVLVEFLEYATTLHIGLFIIMHTNYVGSTQNEAVIGSSSANPVPRYAGIE